MDPSYHRNSFLHDQEVNRAPVFGENVLETRLHWKNSDRNGEEKRNLMWIACALGVFIIHNVELHATFHAKHSIIHLATQIYQGRGRCISNCSSCQVHEVTTESSERAVRFRPGSVSHFDTIMRWSDSALMVRRFIE